MERGDGPDLPGFGWLPRRGEHPGFTLARVSLALVLVLLGQAVGHLHGVTGWAVVAAVVSWCVFWAAAGTACFAGLQAWSWETGFGVHRDGDLTFTATDLHALAVVLAVVVGVAVLTRRIAAAGVNGP